MVLPKMTQISSTEMLEKAGGYTEEQQHGAQEMIDRIKSRHDSFKIAVEDVLVMHVAQNLSFEHIESTLESMIITP